MTHFLVNIDKSFLKRVTNIIFIRDPKEIILSYSKVIPYPKLSDIGIKMQVDLFNYLKDFDAEPIILDSKFLLKNPEGVLRKLCYMIGIPYFDDMLKWERGPKNEDGIWAKYWYDNVHNSTSFSSYKKSNIKLSKDLQVRYDEAFPFYHFLTKKSIKA